MCFGFVAVAVATKKGMIQRADTTTNGAQSRAGGKRQTDRQTVYILCRDRGQDSGGENIVLRSNRIESHDMGTKNATIFFICFFLIGQTAPPILYPFYDISGGSFSFIFHSPSSGVCLSVLDHSSSMPSSLLLLYSILFASKNQNISIFVMAWFGLV
jgi:hypothetical protein